MNTLDLEVFGEDERRIRKSNVRHIFTPHKPITDERFFRGLSFPDLARRFFFL